MVGDEEEGGGSQAEVQQRAERKRLCQEGKVLWQECFVKRGFEWEGRSPIAGTRLRVILTPDGYCFDVQCLCDRCSEIGNVSQDEQAFRVGKFCGDMIIEAWSDLLLCESAEDKDPKESKAENPPSLLERLAEKKTAKTALEKLHGMSNAKRAEVLEQMRSAYEWIFSDDRALFKPVIANGEAVVGEHEGEACIPFLVACEASGADAHCLRAKVLEDMADNGLTVKMVKTGKFPRPKHEVAAAVAHSEAKVNRLFRAFKIAKKVPAEAPVAAAPAAPEEENPRKD